MQSSFLENNENPVEFLYLDRQRIASLIGQLSDKGQLTGLKSSASKTLLKEGGGDASIPGVAKMEGKRATTSAESLEETWDPFWTNAYSFLKDVEGNFAVPIEKAKLGSMVKFEALIQFVDP